MTPGLARASPRAAVAEGFRSLLGPGFAVVAEAPQGGAGGLTDDEQAYIGRAVPGRQAEFASARRCARRALADLGVVAGSLVPYPDRSPRWPAGVRGSISHVRSCCAVAVTPEAMVAGVGIDLEIAEPLAPALMDRVCTAAEQTRLAAVAADRRGALAKLIFSAKEAVYKCQYPSTLAVLDFLDVELALDLDGDSFRVVSAPAGVSADWRRLQGRFVFSGDLILTSAVIASRSGPESGSARRMKG